MWLPAVMTAKPSYSDKVGKGIWRGMAFSGGGEGELLWARQHAEDKVLGGCSHVGKARRPC